MMCDSVEPTDGTFVKSYGFLSFAKNMGKNISENLRNKYSQTFRDNVKQSATKLLQMHLKLLQK